MCTSRISATCPKFSFESTLRRLAAPRPASDQNYTGLTSKVLALVSLSLFAARFTQGVPAESQDSIDSIDSASSDDGVYSRRKNENAASIYRFNFHVEPLVLS